MSNTLSIEENNIMIAEFMDKQDVLGVLQTEPFVTNVYFHANQIKSRIAQGVEVKLYYHSSWDWQVPVWSKIIMMIYERGLTPVTQFKFKYFVEKYDLAVMENKPEDGQGVIVEAIQWYNTTKSKL